MCHPTRSLEQTEGKGHLPQSSDEQPSMRAELQVVMSAVCDMPTSELPQLLGELEQVRCTALARLTGPAPIKAEADELLNIDGAARRLGVSVDYLYRHHKTLPFARRIGRRLLFSSAAIERYIRHNRP